MKSERHNFSNERKELRRVGRLFYRRGWSVATSSNYSAVVQRDPRQILVTASGKHKGRLRREDFGVVDVEGKPVDAEQPRTSAETMLHVVLAESPEVGAILHTHSVWGTLLSQRFFAEGQLVLGDFEMLKALHGVSTHDVSVPIKIYDNTQDMDDLAARVRADRRAADPAVQHAFLIRQHGLYAWGRDVEEAARHVEALEFLFEVHGRQVLSWPSQRPACPDV